MTIAIGDKIPAGTLRFLGPDGPGSTTTDEFFAGRKVALFGMPGAFTGTCSGSHMPSVIEAAEALRAGGADEIAVLVVNDVFVADAWAKSTGADTAGIRLITDPDASLTKAMGLDFSAEAVGLIDRCVRYSMAVEDRTVKSLNRDEPGQCTLTRGEALIDQI